MSEQKNKVFVGSGAGTALLTGEKCTPNTVHWTYDTYAYGRGLGKAVVAQGGKKWFFLTADYAFGHDLEKQAAEGVKASGGEVLGAVRHPLGTADYASFLLQAQASGADIVGVANAGDDTITSIKQAAEFGLTRKQKLVGLILGMNGKMPSANQAGVYASTLAYLNAVAATGSDAAQDVVPQMKKFKGRDKLFGDVTIRQDGRVIHPMYLFEVKKPEESKYPYDYYKLVSTIPAEQAFRPLADGGCSLVK